MIFNKKINSVKNGKSFNQLTTFTDFAEFLLIGPTLHQLVTMTTKKGLFLIYDIQNTPDTYLRKWPSFKVMALPFWSSGALKWFYMENTPPPPVFIGLNFDTTADQ